VELLLQTLKKAKRTSVEIRPFVTTTTEYISPENDHHYTVGESTIKIDSFGNILPRRVPAR
jgi:hypothetical protein